MSNYIFDSHCHIQNSSVDTGETGDKDIDTTRYELTMPKEYVVAVAKKIMQMPLNSVGMMGTTIDDSQRMAEIIEEIKKASTSSSSSSPSSPSSPLNVYYGFGVHPWFCESTEQRYPDWKERLEHLVQKYPKATIGECGLDKVARNRATRKLFSMPKQVEFFEYQFELAAKYRRPIIIHSVKTVGKLFEYIRKQLSLSLDRIPPKIMFHSYCGSPDITKSLLNLTVIRDRFYFGFSYFVNSRIQHNEANLRLIPSNRIMWETDFHEIDDVPEYMGKLHELFRSYPELKSVEDLYQLTYHNAKDFFTF